MYIVIEIQKNGDTVSTLVDSYADIKDAKSKYHTILAYASKSDLDIHGASILNTTGKSIANEFYSHKTEEEEE